MNTSAEGFRRLGIDVAMTHDATKSGLDMPARAAETVVKVEVPESGVEVIPPEEPYYPAAEPYAFGVGGRAAEHLGDFGYFVEPPLRRAIAWRFPLLRRLLRLGTAIHGLS